MFRATSVWNQSQVIINSNDEILQTTILAFTLHISLSASEFHVLPHTFSSPQKHLQHVAFHHYSPSSLSSPGEKGSRLWQQLSQVRLLSDWGKSLLLRSRPTLSDTHTHTHTHTQWQKTAHTHTHTPTSVIHPLEMQPHSALNGFISSVSKLCHTKEN